MRTLVRCRQSEMWLFLFIVASHRNVIFPEIFSCRIPLLGICETLLEKLRGSHDAKLEQRWTFYYHDEHGRNWVLLESIRKENRATNPYSSDKWIIVYSCLLARFTLFHRNLENSIIRLNIFHYSFIHYVLATTRNNCDFDLLRKN